MSSQYPKRFGCTSNPFREASFIESKAWNSLVSVIMMIEGEFCPRKPHENWNVEGFVEETTGRLWVFRFDFFIQLIQNVSEINMRKLIL